MRLLQLSRSVDCRGASIWFLDLSHLLVVIGVSGFAFGGALLTAFTSSLLWLIAIVILASLHPVRIRISAAQLDEVRVTRLWFLVLPWWKTVSIRDVEARRNDDWASGRIDTLAFGRAPNEWTFSARDPREMIAWLHDQRANFARLPPRQARSSSS